MVAAGGVQVIGFHLAVLQSHTQLSLSPWRFHDCLTDPGCMADGSQSGQLRFSIRLDEFDARRDFSQALPQARPGITCSARSARHGATQARRTCGQ